MQVKTDEALKAICYCSIKEPHISKKSNCNFREGNKSECVRNSDRTGINQKRMHTMQSLCLSTAAGHYSSLNFTDYCMDLFSKALSGL